MVKVNKLFWIVNIVTLCACGCAFFNAWVSPLPDWLLRAAGVVILAGMTLSVYMTVRFLRNR